MVGGVLLRKRRSLPALLERVSEEDLERLRHELASRHTPASATEHTSTRAAGSRQRSSSTSTVLWRIIHPTGRWKPSLATLTPTPRKTKAPSSTLPKDRKLRAPYSQRKPVLERVS